MGEVETEQRLAEFAVAYVKTYGAAVDQNFAELLAPLQAAGLREQYFPLYGRTLGADCAIAALVTSANLQIFFVAVPEETIRTCLVDRQIASVQPSLDSGNARHYPKATGKAHSRSRG
jgi:hypothetical protein